MSDQQPIPSVRPFSIAELRRGGSRQRLLAALATVASVVLLGVGAFVVVDPSAGDGSDRALESSATDAGSSAPPAPGPASDPQSAAPTDSREAGPSGAATADPAAAPTADDAPASSSADAVVDPDTDPDDEAEETDDGGESSPVVETVGDQPFGPGATPAVAWTVLDLQAVGPAASPSPCDVALAAGSTIAVSPPSVALPASSSTVDLAITYCGEAASVLSTDLGPGVAQTWKGVLVGVPGETAEVQVHVDRDEFSIGGFSTHARFTDEHGSTTEVPIAGMSFGRFSAGAAAGTFTAGGAAPGCSGSCITRAELISSGVGVTAVGLEVDTVVPATISLYVLDSAPVFLGGQPLVAGATPIASSGPGATSWTTDLGELEPDTTYHLVLEAVDSQDRALRVAHSFTTPAPPPGHLSGNDPEPGCSASCIVEAQLQSTSSHDTVGLHVETHTPAKVIAQVGTGIVWQGDEPVVQGAITEATFAEYVTSWDATFEGLAGSTDYHVVVRATDDDGNTDVQTGQFTTAAAPPVAMVVRFEKLLVRWDADRSTLNRGELRFAWGIDDLRLGTRAEAKHHTGNQITLETDAAGWLVAFDEGEEHLFTLAGGERDPIAIDPLCQAEAPSEIPRWRTQNRRDCDNVKWNTAPMWVGLADIEAAPFCSEYGIDGPAGNRKCLDVDSPNYGDDVPRFASIVSFEPFG